MEFHVDHIEVYGLEKAIKASGNPMRTEINNGPVDEKDLARAIKLGTTPKGEGHDNFLKGIIVQFDVYAPLYWWKQAQRYHWLDFISSQSTMHSLLKFDVKSQCVSDTSEEVLSIIQKMIDEYKALEDEEQKKVLWRKIVASLPCGFCLGASMTTNYQQLKTIYFQRRFHKLKEWHIFCDMILNLPKFKELVIKE